MKKLFLFSMLCLMAFSMKAQRCAVLDFQVGTGVSEEEIDGISYNFRVNFRPSGYTLLERDQINRTIKSQNYNRTDMTLQQMLRVGRNLDASIIVVGTMNKFMDEYSVDIRVINVATGTTSVSESATFEKKAYRTSMENLAKKLASKLATTSSKKSSQTSSSSKQGYVDLGLPSGTIWKYCNESEFYTYYQAVNKFGNSLPSKEEFDELKNVCQWTPKDNGYIVTGPNGKSIVLVAGGHRDCMGREFERTPQKYGSNVFFDGRYWTCTEVEEGDSGDLYTFHITSSYSQWLEREPCCGHFVLLVYRNN